MEPLLAERSDMTYFNLYTPAVVGLAPRQGRAAVAMVVVVGIGETAWES